MRGEPRGVAQARECRCRAREEPPEVMSAVWLERPRQEEGPTWGARAVVRVGAGPRRCSRPRVPGAESGEAT
ncbi:hypothetical protein NDU88_003162 [Pleurodeles waltl]|uniref:Uncharacterized protein n=1 Tax=Pleurodeles waltl TaxID=8319 RepID=A0AAV7KU45_PLEWA|nr:hypothetical protein NDU88_003162 [Pleurodeles waltl]